MFRGDEKILMVFKKGSMHYKFYSIETAYENESGKYIGESGVFKGKEITLAPTFSMSTSSFIDNAIGIGILQNSSGRFSTMHEYAI